MSPITCCLYLPINNTKCFGVAEITCNAYRQGKRSRKIFPPFLRNLKACSQDKISAGSAPIIACFNFLPRVAVSLKFNRDIFLRVLQSMVMKIWKTLLAKVHQWLNYAQFMRNFFRSPSYAVIDFITPQKISDFY